LDYISHDNENPRPFEWTKGSEKLQRIIEATKEYQATHPRKPRRRRPDRITINNQLDDVLARHQPIGSGGWAAVPAFVISSLQSKEML